MIVLADIDDWLRGIRKRTDHDFNAMFGRKTIEEFELCMRAVDGIICSTPWLAERYALAQPAHLSSAATGSTSSATP